MKIKKIYKSVDNFNGLVNPSDNSFKRIDKFLENFDSSCRVNFDKNRETLKVFLVDELNCYPGDAFYVPEGNYIYVAHLKQNFTHELLHMSSTKTPSGYAFASYKACEQILLPIEEGITEYLASIIDNRELECYFLESFVAKMLYLSTDRKIAIPYFKATGKEFMNMFDETNIYQVLMNLRYLSEDEELDFRIPGVAENSRACFYDMLEALIDIELRKRHSQKRLDNYRTSFLDTLEDEWINDYIGDFDKHYHNKVRKLIDGRIERR